MGLRELRLSDLDSLCQGMSVSVLEGHSPGTGESDVRDAFYQFSIPELGSWFCIDECYLAGELDGSQFWDDRTSAYVPVDASTPIYVSHH